MMEKLLKRAMGLTGKRIYELMTFLKNEKKERKKVFSFNKNSDPRTLRRVE